MNKSYVSYKLHRSFFPIIRSYLENNNLIQYLVNLKNMKTMPERVYLYYTRSSCEETNGMNFIMIYFRTNEKLPNYTYSLVFL